MRHFYEKCTMIWVQLGSSIKNPKNSNTEIFLTILKKVNISNFLTSFWPVFTEMDYNKRLTFNMLNKSHKISITKESDKPK